MGCVDYVTVFDAATPLQLIEQIRQTPRNKDTAIFVVSGDTAPSDELIRQARDMVPVLRERAEKTEADRRIPEETHQAFLDAGFYRMFRPRALGGFELDPVTQFSIAEALAAMDSAAAWNVQVCNASELYGGWFGQDAAREVFGAPETIVAGSFNPTRERSRWLIGRRPRVTGS